MKYLFSILIILSGITSCQVCADCTCTDSYTGANGVIEKSTTVEEVCGREDINDARGTHTSTRTITENGQQKQVMVTTICDCEKK